MSRYTYPTQISIVDELQCFKVGDLVVTLMGEYGIVVGQGKHDVFYQDRSNYLKVLINGNVYNYIAGSLKLIKKLDK